MGPGEQKLLQQKLIEPTIVIAKSNLKRYYSFFSKRNIIIFGKKEHKLESKCIIMDKEQAEYLKKKNSEGKSGTSETELKTIRKVEKLLLRPAG